MTLPYAVRLLKGLCVTNRQRLLDRFCDTRHERQRIEAAVEQLRDKLGHLLEFHKPRRIEALLALLQLVYLLIGNMEADEHGAHVTPDA